MPFYYLNGIRISFYNYRVLNRLYLSLVYISNNNSNKEYYND